MNKTLIMALAFTAGALFNAADAAGKKKKEQKNTGGPAARVDLKTASDSLSYSAGMVRTDGLVPYLQQSFGVDTAYMADFIRGFEDATANGFADRNKAYYAGEQIAMMVSERMLPFIKEEFAGRADSVDTRLFYRGFTDALRKVHATMSPDTAKAYFDTAFKQAVDDRNAANKKAGEDFLAANKTQPGVVELPSGLQYKILTRGSGAVPAANDEVTVKYEGRLIDGTVFDSSYERPGETSKFRPDQVIKGWTEALTMMPVGSKWELYIPYNLAYGERQAGKIKPYSALIFTVEMVSIKNTAAAKTGAETKAKTGATLRETARHRTGAGARAGRVKTDAAKAKTTTATKALPNK